MRSFTACPGSRKRMARTRSVTLTGTVSISNFAEVLATPPPGTPQGRRDRGRGCCLTISTSCALIATLPSSSLPSGSSTPVAHRLVGDQYASNGPGDAMAVVTLVAKFGPNGDAFQTAVLGGKGAARWGTRGGGRG